MGMRFDRLRRLFPWRQRLCRRCDFRRLCQSTVRFPSTVPIDGAISVDCARETGPLADRRNSTPPPTAWRRGQILWSLVHRWAGLVGSAQVRAREPSSDGDRPGGTPRADPGMNPRPRSAGALAFGHRRPGALRLHEAPDTRAGRRLDRAPKQTGRRKTITSSQTSSCCAWWSSWRRSSQPTSSSSNCSSRPCSSPTCGSS